LKKFSQFDQMDTLPIEYALHYHPVVAILRGPDLPTPAAEDPSSATSTITSGQLTPNSGILSQAPTRRTSLAFHHRRTSSATQPSRSNPASLIPQEKLQPMLISALTSKPKNLFWDAGGKSNLYRVLVFDKASPL
jgi:hypothetical protein